MGYKVEAFGGETTVFKYTRWLNRIQKSKEIEIISVISHRDGMIIVTYKE